MAYVTFTLTASRHSASPGVWRYGVYRHYRDYSQGRSIDVHDLEGELEGQEGRTVAQTMAAVLEAAQDALGGRVGGELPEWD